MPNTSQKSLGKANRFTVDDGKYKSSVKTHTVQNIGQGHERPQNSKNTLYVIHCYRKYGNSLCYIL